MNGVKKSLERKISGIVRFDVQENEENVEKNKEKQQRKQNEKRTKKNLQILWGADI